MSGSTTPTSSQVEAWLAQGYAKINRAITNAGYTVPIGSTAALYNELVGLENLYAAAYVLRARGIDVASGETEKTSEAWLKDFYTQLEEIVSSNLALMGATEIAAATTGRRRRIRTLQMRKVDGYSRKSHDADFEEHGAEYLDDDRPSE